MTSHPAPDRSERRAVLAAIVVLHVAVLVALINTGVIAPETISQVLHATLIRPTPPQPEPPRPRLPPSQPKPASLPRAEPLPAPVLAAAATAPSPIPVPPAVAAPVVALAPVAVISPRFDADYLDNPKPAYPPLARRRGEEGKVLLRVFVDADGRPGKVELQRSSGSPRLDEAALSTVSRWKFIPARQGNEAVAAWVQVPIVFKLEN